MNRFCRLCNLASRIVLAPILTQNFKARIHVFGRVWSGHIGRSRSLGRRTLLFFENCIGIYLFGIDAQGAMGIVRVDLYLFPNSHLPGLLLIGCHSLYLNADLLEFGIWRLHRRDLWN